MRTKVRSISVNTRDERVIISVDGVLKRKFLFRLLAVDAVNPSEAVVELLRETLVEVERLYETLPRHFGVGEKKFNSIWGSVVNALERDMIDPSSPQAVDLLYNAHFDLDKLHRAEKAIEKANMDWRNGWYDPG